ncbi:NADAR family protein [Methylocapsa sp. S129]|uniref:NADAR family protein n=1 Tax=Methylocapsa sp. S129 TaxID=1641869 RepID=UPI00352B6264
MSRSRTSTAGSAARSFRSSRRPKAASPLTGKSRPRAAIETNIFFEKKWGTFRWRAAFQHEASPGPSLKSLVFYRGVSFWPVSIILDGVRYRSVEHAYQAAKTLDPTERLKIQLAETPSRAKELGRSLTMRSDWTIVKIPTMLWLQWRKYRNRRLAKLAATGARQIFELNSWNDIFWGVVENDGGYEGANALGQILALVRDEIGNKIMGAADIGRL